MDYVFYAPQSDEEYDRLVREVSADIDEDPETQRSLTTITLDCEDRDNPDDANIIVYSREWTPENRHPKHELVPIHIDSVAEMGIRLPSRRMLRLPPRRDFGGEYSYRGNARPPYTSLHYNNDIVVASPEVVRILEAVQQDTGLDIESMVRDLESTFNREVEELDRVVQLGLHGVDGERGIVLQQQRELERKVRAAYIEILNRLPDHGYERNLGAAIEDLIFELESGRVRMPNLLRESRLTVEVLVADYNALEIARSGAKSTSHDVFVNTIEDDGIGMPSFFEDAETAVTEVGFDSDQFLKI